MISHLRTNHRNNPLGIEEEVRFSFVADEGDAFAFRLLGQDAKTVLFERTVRLEEAIGFGIEYPLLPGIRYFWQINDSQLASFLIAEPLDAPFITPESTITHPVMFTEFETDEVQAAWLFITGLGFYRAFINGKRVGNDYLTPGLNDYRSYLRYQTYDVLPLLQKSNKLEVVLGDGLYKGRMGFDNHPGNIYGDSYLLCAKLVIVKKDGTKQVVKTGEDWKARPSEFSFSTIYDGEIRDANADTHSVTSVSLAEESFHLVPQFNPTITEQELLKPTLIHTPSGEEVLDFGQNMVGFARFVCRETKGTKIHLQYGEILQNGNFYRENLRSAKAELWYTASGKETTVDAFFTFYGFRYVKVEGMKKVNPDDFTGVVLHTDLEKTISVHSSSAELNQLIHNALWGQKGNFLDVPTDCPQRDERLGWTGDSQVFARTACMNMNAKLFYKKYTKDLRADQVRFYDGLLPAFSPSLEGSAREGGAVWADAGTIIPMCVYEEYGDQSQLADDYPLMKDYVEALIRNDVESLGGSHLVSNRFTFGDWLAMDGMSSQSVKGGTDDVFISSVYYMHSLSLVSKAAKILGKEEDAKRYANWSHDVKEAIAREYFTPNGRLALDTQTAYILALHFHLVEDPSKVVECLKARLAKDGFRMKTGFTGTPLALQTLMDNGLAEDAYRMLFSQECPGWMFAVNHGATTIWERWNSVLEDGTISGTSMNSLNHYAYGSVCEAIYTRIVGLRNLGDAYSKVLIAPVLNYRLKSICLDYESVRGPFHIDYEIQKDNVFSIHVSIPHGCSAHIVLPSKSGDNEVDVGEGTYVFSYPLSRDYIHPFSMHSSFIDILSCPKAVEACQKYPAFLGIASGNRDFEILSPFGLTQLGYLPVTAEQAKELDEALKKVEA